jgi:diguanylate cyclase (GGDEF)-like protein
MAHHDALTGLPNRVMFREHLERTLPRVKRGDSLALLSLDLDGFKAVNDTLGHPAGDDLLRQVASVLRRTVRETDLVARLGGDEFAIIQVGAEGPEELVVLAERLVEALRAPFEVLGRRAEIGTSIGIAPASADTMSADELLRSADVALYRAKATGRGRWCFFEPGMDDEIHARRTLEMDLRQAVREGQLELHYQPLMEARSRSLSGFEALLRWTHPQRGVVSPAVFIPLAEETGLIREIGAWVLHRACAMAATWPAHIRIAVNLSPVQLLGGRLVEEVVEALRVSGLAAARLELEITESVLLQDSDQTLKILHQLHALGTHISMDDFGTGYSSLSYLRRFPFDKIKIDQSFILEFEGCNELQGYLFSRPVPGSQVAGLIQMSETTNTEMAAA